jgi:hypothetical protein
MGDDQLVAFECSPVEPLLSLTQLGFMRIASWWLEMIGRESTPTGVRYFITFSCYGARVHGDDAGTVDRAHNLYGSRLVGGDVGRVAAELGLMKEAAYLLNRERREVVLLALQQHCFYRGWVLLAAHVRSTHAHVVVEAELEPERVMTEFKTSASRALNRLEGKRRRWARHGSTRRLFRDRDVQEVIGYVVDGQGEPMSVFVEERWFAG